MVSGECYGTAKGYELSMSDEMGLLFRSADSLKRVAGAALTRVLARTFFFYRLLSETTCFWRGT